MRILIAGGSGTVGVRLADALLENGNQVLVYDDMSGIHSRSCARWLDRRRNASALSFVFRDLFDTNELERAMTGVDAVIHAAAPPPGADAPAELSVRVSGTLALLSAMERRAPDAHLVLLSDATVYGCPALLRNGTAMFAAREAQILAPESNAAAAAASAEQYAFAAARSRQRKATVLRMPAVYASDALYAATDAWIARLVTAARAGAAVAPLADPRWPWDLVHADDVATAVQAVLLRPEVAAGEAFNVAGGARSAPSIWELVQHLGSIGGRARLLPPMAGQQPTPVLDLTRIQRMLGWEPRIAWRDGIAGLFASVPTEWAVESARSGSTGSGTLEAGAQALVAWPRAEGLA